MEKLRIRILEAKTLMILRIQFRNIAYNTRGVGPGSVQITARILEARILRIQIRNTAYNNGGVGLGTRIPGLWTCRSVPSRGRRVRRWGRPSSGSTSSPDPSTSGHRTMPCANSELNAARGNPLLGRCHAQTVNWMPREIPSSDDAMRKQWTECRARKSPPGTMPCANSELNAARENPILGRCHAQTVNWMPRAKITRRQSFRFDEMIKLWGVFSYKSTVETG
jgi:hypothetical protein